jgi:hypothetical protein
MVYGEVMKLLGTYDLPVSRPRLPGLLATSDGRCIAVGKELTSRRWLTPKALVVGRENGSDGPTTHFIVPLHPDKENSRGVNQEHLECKMINDARTGAAALSV